MSIEIRGRAVYICMYRQKFPEVTWYSKRNKCTKMNGGAHAQNSNDGPSYEVKNSCFLIDWSCRLPLKKTA